MIKRGVIVAPERRMPIIGLPALCEQMYKICIHFYTSVGVMLCYHDLKKSVNSPCHPPGVGIILTDYQDKEPYLP